ncbi:MAG: lamin tail domain-containing protein [Sulfuricaulis sp.]
MIANGDIVVTSSDGQTYTVNGVAYLASGGGGGGGQYSVADLKINEVLPDPDVAYAAEWVELYNPTPQAIDLSGAVIDDLENAGSAPYTIPAGTSIPAHGYRVLERTNLLQQRRRRHAPADARRGAGGQVQLQYLGQRQVVGARERRRCLGHNHG